MIQPEIALLTTGAALFGIAIVLCATGMWLPLFTLILGLLGGSFGLLFYFGMFSHGK